jgi:hypothetical protein
MNVVMPWFILTGFIAGHLLLYLAVLRHVRAFARERAMVTYHALAFAFVLAAVVAAFAYGTIGFAASCGLLALYFIYCISFLELWTLSEGSYSLQILLRVSQQGATSREELFATCQGIGADKKHHRLGDLLTLKLIARADDGRLELSPAGSLLVGSLHAIMRFTTTRDAG